MGRYTLFVVLGLFVGMNYMIISTNQTKKDSLVNSIDYLNRKIAQNAATSRANVALNALKDLNVVSNFDPQKMNYSKNVNFPKGAKVEMTIENSGYIVRPETQTDTLYPGDYKITSIASYAGVRCSTVVYGRQLPFSYYAWFIDKNCPGYLGPGEGCYGPVHCNGKLSVAGKAPNGGYFDGKVTSPFMPKLQSWHGSRATMADNFPGDNNDFNHPRIDMSNVKSALKNHQNVANLDTKIKQLFPGIRPNVNEVFLVLGTNKFGEPVVDVRIQNLPNAAVGSIKIADLYQTMPDGTVNYNAGAILHSDKYNLHLRGELDGKMTISTNKKVYFDDDIVYKDDPRTNPDSDDMLGIMAQDGCVVRTSYDSFTGKNCNDDINDPDYPGCVIMANIYTPQTIKIEKWDDYPVSANRRAIGKRGNFTTIGGRVQSRLSYTWDGGKGNWNGFPENIIYDERLRRTGPPGIPYTDEKTIVKWHETF